MGVSKGKISTARHPGWNLQHITDTMNLAFGKSTTQMQRLVEIWTRLYLLHWCSQFSNKLYKKYKLFHLYHGSGGSSEELNWVPEVPNHACSARIKRKRSSKRSNATSSFTLSGFSAAGNTLFACIANQNLSIIDLQHYCPFSVQNSRYGPMDSSAFKP